MELIDKADVVAEIERLKHKLLDNIICESDKEWAIRTAHQLNRIIWFIDTLEVKEIDLDEEIERFVKSDEFQKASGTIKVTNLLAKHFFELGIQQSNHNKNEEKS